LITEAMNAWSNQRATDEAMRDLEDARVPCGKVYELSEVFDDPQVKARELIRLSSIQAARSPCPCRTRLCAIGDVGRSQKSRADVGRAYG